MAEKGREETGSGQRRTRFKRAVFPTLKGACACIEVAVRGRGVIPRVWEGGLRVRLPG